MATYDLDVDLGGNTNTPKLLDVPGMLPGDAVQAVITGHARVPASMRRPAPPRDRRTVASAVAQGLPARVVNVRQFTAQRDAAKASAREVASTMHMPFTPHHRDGRTSARYVFPGADEVRPRATRCSCLAYLHGLDPAHHVLAAMLGMNNASRLAIEAVHAHVIPPPPTPLPVLSGRDRPCACSVLGPTMVRGVVAHFPDAARHTWKSVGVPATDTVAKRRYLAKRNATMVAQWEGERASLARDKATLDYARALASGTLRAPTYKPMSVDAFKQNKRAAGFAHTNLVETPAVDPVRRRVAAHAVRGDPILSRMVG